MGQREFIDSMKKTLRFQKEDSNKALTYTRISEQYDYMGEAKTVFIYVDSAIALSKKIHFKKTEASARENRGYAYLMLGYPDSAKNDFLTALKVRKEIGDKRGIAQSYYSIGVFFYNNDSLIQALEFLYNSMTLFEEIKNIKGVAICLDRLGQISIDQGDDSSALNNDSLAINAFTKIGDTLAVAETKLQMGAIEYGHHNYLSAQKLYHESLRLNEEYGSSQAGIGYCYMLLGDVSQKQGKYFEAMNMYDSAKVKYKNIHQAEGLAIVGAHIAKIYIQTKQFSKVRPLLTDFLRVSLNNKNKSDIADAYENLSVLDSVLGNDKKALIEYKVSLNYRDSISQIRNNKNLERIMLQHENEKKEAKMKALQDIKDSEALKSRNKQNIAIISLSLVVAAILSVAWIQWRNNVAKQKINILLEATLINLKTVQNKLIQSEKLASLGEVTAGIAHEIQNPLNFVNNFSEVNVELIKEAEKEINDGNMSEVKAIFNNIKENEIKISHHGKRADAIVKGMLQHSRTNSENKELIDINSLVAEYFRLSYKAMRTKNNFSRVKLETDFDQAISRVNISPQDIGRVFLNLYNNAFYAVEDRKKENIEGYEPTVTVTTRMNNSKIEIKVRDNGNGIPQNIKDKIFQPFFTTKPTGQGTGLGLSLSYDIIKSYGGEIIVNSKDGKYCEFVVIIPRESVN